MDMENRKWRAGAEYGTPVRRLRHVHDWNPRGQDDFYKTSIAESGRWTIWYKHQQEEPERKTIVIDGDKFSSLHGFYQEVDRLFRNNPGRDIRYNLSTLNDLLRGGSKEMKFEEPIRLVWKNSAKSKQDLGLRSTNMWAVGESFFEILTGMIEAHKHIQLSLE
jgi:RNAse (barnase) inhibitor barstar